MDTTPKPPEQAPPTVPIMKQSRWPIRTFLILLVLACLIPGLIGAALLVHHDYRTARIALERNSLLTTRALVQAVDSHLLKTLAVAQSLSSSDELRHGNFAGPYREARAFLATNGVASAISLSDTNGQMLFNTSREFGTPLPKHGNPELVQRVVETGQPAISNLFRGSISQQLLISIEVPVVIEGKVTYVLTAVLRPDIFNAFLQSQGLPQDWIAGIFDQEGKFVTRTLAPEQFIGKQPSAELLRRASAAGEGVFESVTPDGIPVLSIFSRSPKTGWFVALGIPRKELETEYLRPLGLLVAGTLLLFAIGLGLAWWVSEKIASSVRALSAQAKSLGMGEDMVVPDVHIAESHEVAHALLDAGNLLRARNEALAAERRGREAQLEHLVAERTAALQAAIRESERLARCDVLTGLQNRRSASERLHEEFLRMKRTGSQFTALLLDIDYFKRINDTYGHETGDNVLRMIADVLGDSIRATDFLARFGGEEFLILLPDTGEEGARTIAEKIRSAVSDTDFPGVGRVTVSLGGACASISDNSEEDVLRHADAALYEAKGKGRNQVQLH